MNTIARKPAYTVLALLLCATAAQAGPGLSALSLSVKAPATLADTTPVSTLTIGQSAFQPTSDSPYTLSFPTYGALATNRTNLAAPVQLPHGAKVKYILCYLYDVDYEQDIKCELIRMRLSNGEYHSIASARSEVTDDGAVRVAAEFDEQIDNLDYSYALYAYPAERTMEWPDGPRMGIKGVSIGYEPPDI